MSKQRMYRGLRKDNGKPVVGCLVEFSDMSIIFSSNVVITSDSETRSEYIDSTFWFEVIPESVGQSTGREDKHGEEIFGKMKVRHANGFVYAVVWNDGRLGWTLQRPNGTYRQEWSEKIEIIHDKETT